MMNLLRSPLRAGITLLVALFPLGALQAGDDAASAHAANPSLSAQMNDYLQGQKVAHSVETTGGDGKGEGAESLTVKIYGVSAAAQQDALCTALGATVKKGHVREATVLFFTMNAAADAQAATFQPSQLPSGNADVQFPRDTKPSAYRLQRTVKL